MTQFTVIADTHIEGTWFNTSLTHFAIVPDAPDQDVDTTAAVVDVLAEKYRRAREDNVAHDVMNEALADLYDLHARHLILWPLGVQWDQSVLGEVNGRRFNNMLEETDPRALTFREDIDNLLVRLGAYGPTVVHERSQELWRLFMTLRLATFGLDATMFVTQEHIFALVNAARIDGVWAEWTTETIRRGLVRFTRLLASERGDEMFCASVLNPPRRIKVGPRVAPLVISHPHLTWLHNAYETWMDDGVAKTKKGARNGLKLFADYLMTIPPEKTGPECVFSRPVVRELLEFAATWSTPNTRGLALAKLTEFAEWFCMDYAMIQGLPAIKLELHRYDLDQFLRTIPRSPNYTAEVVARPMPTRFHLMLKKIIQEDDFAWPKSMRHGISGKPVHFFPWANPATGKIEEVFCEVLPRLLLLLLELPLRNVQARRLDSGEGDDRTYDVDTRTWSDARGPFAGLWTKRKAKNPRRGVFREIVTDVGTIAGFWINSNKTASTRALFDETAGYEIPWQHDEVLVNLAAMRAWQEKYNRVAGPLAYASLPPSIFKNEDPSRAVRAVLPDRFYLFRYPQNVGHPRAREAPAPYYNVWQFFLDALDEMERRLREEDPEGAIRIITARGPSGQPTEAIFTMHGMRSSTLTALHLAGVPIGVLSKLVAGHATILMTLRYTKFDPAHVNQILNEARVKALTESKERFANFLKSATLNEAMRMSARLADDGLNQIKGSYDESTGWSRVDIGICPNGGTRCGIGGEAISKRREKDGREKSAHRPVPGGPRNCVRCRFFITGVPFLIPLWAHSSAILARADAHSKRIDSVVEEVEQLKRERRTLGKDAPASLRNRITALDEVFVMESDARDLALADLHATVFLIEKIRTIAATGDAEDDARLPMLLGADGVPEVAARPSTRFELVDQVVQASRWFPSLASPDLEAERNEFLNRILHSNGYVPITLAPLSVQERRRAADALAELLLVELGAVETQNVIEGRKTLAEVGLQDRLERAAAAAIGRPIDRLVIAPPTAPMIEAVAE